MASNLQYALVVDAFKWSSYIVAYFKEIDVEPIHVFSSSEVIDSFAGSSTYLPSDYGKNFLFSSHLKEQILSELTTLPISTILPGTETGVPLANSLSQILQLPSNLSSQAPARNNKFAMSDLLESKGLLGNKHYAAHSLSDALNWIEEFSSYPSILKPLQSTGSDNVYFCESPSDVERHFNKILSRKDIHGNKNEKVFIQRFLEGKEFLVNAVTCDGKHHVIDAWQVKKKISNSRILYQTEDLLSHDHSASELIHQYLNSALDVLGIRVGATHSELIVTDDGPQLIDFSPRFGGNVNPKVHDSCFGHNQVELALDAYFKPDLFHKKIIDLNHQKKLQPHLKHVVLSTEKSGLVSEIPLKNSLSKLSSYFSSQFMVGPSDRVEPTTSLKNRPGKVWLMHQNPKVIEADYQAISALGEGAFSVSTMADHPAQKELNENLLDPVLTVLNTLSQLPIKFPNAFSLASGRPHDAFCQVTDIMESSLPAFRDYVSRVRKHSFDHLLGQYGPTGGIINELVARHLQIDEGIGVKPQEILMVSGFQEAVVICANTLFKKNQPLLVPDPIFTGAKGIAKLSGIPIHGFHYEKNFDFSALCSLFQRLIKKGEKPAALYVVPDFCNPQGVSMSLSERQDLLSWAHKNDVWIIEDNAYALFNFSDERLPTLRALDKHQRVIYVHTTAKTMFPGLRLGYMIAPNELIRTNMLRAKSYITVNTSPISQAIFGGLLLRDNYSLLPLNQKRTAWYKKNKEVMLSALKEKLSKYDGVTFNNPDGGFFITVSLPFDFGDRELEECAGKFDVIVFPAVKFSINNRCKNMVRLAFSNLEQDDLIEAVNRFCNYIDFKLSLSSGAALHSNNSQAFFSTSQSVEPISDDKASISSVIPKVSCDD